MIIRLYYFYSLLIAFLIFPNLQSQTLKEKIGQMVWTGFSGTKLHDTIKVDLQQRNLGGVILFATNISNPNQVKLLNDTIKMFGNTPPFIAVDQEGGRVARLNKTNGFDTTHSAYTLGTVFNLEDSTRKAAGIMAEWLHESGFNVNLAPVADVNVDSLSPAIGKLKRSYSRIPDSVFVHANWFIDEFHKKKIVTSLKHFPGHGSALQDSHFGFTDITTTWADSELVPYQSLITNGYKDFVMMGHLYNVNLDSVYPASLSKKVTTDLLKTQLGYEGLVITDAMGMQAITQNYSFEDAIVLAVNAGNDVLLYTAVLRNNSSLVRQVVNVIEQKVIQGVISQNRIDESYNKIMKLKSDYGLITSVKDLADNSLPDGFELHQNYPNPFNATTTIKFSVPHPHNPPFDKGGTQGGSLVTLKVFDILGREVATLVNWESQKEPGIYEVSFSAGSSGDAVNLASGVYIYTLFAESFGQSGSFIQSRKMILLR